MEKKKKWKIAEKQEIDCKRFQLILYNNNNEEKHFDILSVESTHFIPTKIFVKEGNIINIKINNKYYYKLKSFCKEEIKLSDTMSENLNIFWSG